MSKGGVGAEGEERKKIMIAARERGKKHVNFSRFYTIYIHTK